MLSKEAVPHAETVLASLAKHLEARLSFGKRINVSTTFFFTQFRFFFSSWSLDQSHQL
jgi:hypothetical protein